MRFVRITISVLAVISVLLMTFFYVLSISHQNKPEILCSVEGLLEAPTKVTDEELLKYVTASDAEDGDLTDNIVVERKMYFYEKGITSITFAVSDSDNNVTKLERNVKFTDYYSPKIILLDDLIIPINSSVDLLSCVKVEDAYEGDITHRVKMIRSDFNNLVAGIYNVNFKITNAFADTRSIDVPIIITEDDYSAVKIKLSDYIIYVPKNSKLNFEDYITEVVSDNGPSYNVSNVEIDSSEFDAENEGAYNIYYSINSWDRVVTKTRLVVVVE